jgi:large subunit ribosomal protein L29
MKPSVIKEMTTQELEEKIFEEKKSYDKLRMAHHISPLENPMELKMKRKDIARLGTELRHRQLHGETK